MTNEEQREHLTHLSLWVGAPSIKAPAVFCNRGPPRREKRGEAVRSVRLLVAAALAVVVLVLGASGQLLRKVIFAATGTRTLITAGSGCGLNTPERQANGGGGTPNSMVRAEG